METTVKIVRVQEASNKEEHKGLLRITVVGANKVANAKPEDYLDALYQMKNAEGKVTDATKDYVRKLVEASKGEKLADKVDFKVNLVVGENGSLWLNPQSYAIQDADAFLAKF